MERISRAWARASSSQGPSPNACPQRRWHRGGQITSGTVLLAHRISVEQLSRVQGVGVGLALNGKENPMFVSYTE